MIFRKIRKNKGLFLVNLIGLSLAISCILLVTLYAKKELSYDRFHSKADRIYRITMETKSEGDAISLHPARTAGSWTDNLTDYAQIEKITKFSSFRNAIVKIDESIFYSNRTFSTDSNFFDVFDFEVIRGNEKEVLKKPQMAIITKSIAQKYFGTDDVIGKSINIMHQFEKKGENYTIGGVMADFPKNSHFHIDILTSSKVLKNRNKWAYTYCLTKPKPNLKIITKNIETKLKKENANNFSRKVHFQKLTDIHLHSKKSRELESNGSLRSIIMLITGVLIILLIALINFYNLSRVQFISEIKTVKVKIINGASKWNIVLDKLKETIPLLAFAIFLSFIFAFAIFKIAEKNLWNTIQNEWFLTAIILFISTILILGTSLLSIAFSKITVEKQLVTKHYYGYKIPLVAQLALSIITITSTLVLHRQMNFINKLHPLAQSSNMLIIPEVPMEATYKYELFKQELLKSTEIKDVTAAMEKPGGNIIDNFNFELEGLENNESRSIKILTVAPNFFDVMKIKPIVGSTDLNKSSLPDWEQKAIKVSIAKMKNETIDKETEEKVLSYKETYVVNESAIKLFGFPNPQDVLNKQFMLKHQLQNLFPKGEIIGVVPDFHYTNLFSKEEPMVIVAKQLFSQWFIIELNTNDKNKTLAEINNIWTNIYPNYPFNYEFITDNYKTIYKGEYTQTKLLSVFAIISILLSAIGILALARFSIQRRTKEIGIRKVNGAKISEILTMLNKGFVKWVIAAFVIATPFAYYAMNKWLENFAYKTALSWWIFALAGLSALLIALLTVSWQSYRAASRNPVEALRYE